MFDTKRPTVLLLGRWQPWHDGHFALFQRAIKKTGQVLIGVRDVQDHNSENNPFSFNEIKNEIKSKLLDHGYREDFDYQIQLIPNITNITYGRDVGYVFEQEKFEEQIEAISATKIRKKLREEGKLEN